MNKQSNTRNNSSPSATSQTGSSGKQSPPITHIGIVSKKSLTPSPFVPYLIQDIKISDDERGIIIEYELNEQTEIVTELLVQSFKTIGVTATAETLPDPEPHTFLILEGKHFLAGHLQERHLNGVNPHEAYRLILLQLDKTTISSLINRLLKLMKEREELAAKFTYKDVSEISPGVDPKQLDFLRDASTIGAFEWVKTYTGQMITEYFTTEVTQADIAEKYGITEQAVRERITRGMSKMRRVLYKDKPELEQEDSYPLEQIQKGKDRNEVFKTERHKVRRGQASKGRDHSKEIKRPGVEKLVLPNADTFTAKPDRS